MPPAPGAWLAASAVPVTETCHSNILSSCAGSVTLIEAQHRRPHCAPGTPMKTASAMRHGCRGRGLVLKRGSRGSSAHLGSPSAVSELAASWRGDRCLDRPRGVLQFWARTSAPRGCPWLHCGEEVLSQVLWQVLQTGPCRRARRGAPSGPGVRLPQPEPGPASAVSGQPLPSGLVATPARRPAPRQAQTPPLPPASLLWPRPNFPPLLLHCCFISRERRLTDLGV